MYSRNYQLNNFFPFVVKRIIRLDPAYFATIAGVILLSYISTFVPGWRGEFDITWARVAGHLAYLNGFLGLPWLVSVFWTLAIEFQFYLLIALIFPLLCHASSQHRWITLFLLCTTPFFFDLEKATSLKPFVFQHMFLFALGITTFWYYQGLVSCRTYIFLSALCAFGVAYSLGFGEMIVGTATAYVIAAFPNLKTGRVLTYFGAISYSLYLVHLPIGGRVLGLMERIPVIPELLGVLIATAASVIAADILYRLVEKPSLKLASTVSYRKRSNERAESPPAKGRVNRPRFLIHFPIIIVMAAIA